jgi:hypothetical protein
MHKPMFLCASVQVRGMIRFNCAGQNIFNTNHLQKKLFPNSSLPSFCRFGCIFGSGHPLLNWRQQTRQRDSLDDSLQARLEAVLGQREASQIQLHYREWEKKAWRGDTGRIGRLPGHFDSLAAILSPGLRGGSVH